MVKLIIGTVVVQLLVVAGVIGVLTAVVVGVLKLFGVIG